MPTPTSPPEPENITWRVHPDARLSVRYWGEECVMYHGASGDTHRLAQPVGQLLQALVRGSATPQTLSEQIDLDLDDVYMTLEQMRRLGITECVA